MPPVKEHMSCFLHQDGGGKNNIKKTTVMKTSHIFFITAGSVAAGIGLWALLLWILFRAFFGFFYLWLFLGAMSSL
jgi:hypothetical protein